MGGARDRHTRLLVRSDDGDRLQQAQHAAAISAAFAKRASSASRPSTNMTWNHPGEAVPSIVSPRSVPRSEFDSSISMSVSVAPLRAHPCRHRIDCLPSDSGRRRWAEGFSRRLRRARTGAPLRRGVLDRSEDPRILLQHRRILRRGLTTKKRSAGCRSSLATRLGAGTGGRDLPRRSATGGFCCDRALVGAMTECRRCVGAAALAGRATGSRARRCATDGARAWCRVRPSRV